MFRGWRILLVCALCFLGTPPIEAGIITEAQTTSGEVESDCPKIVRSVAQRQIASEAFWRLKNLIPLKGNPGQFKIWHKHFLSEFELNEVVTHYGENFGVAAQDLGDALSLHAIRVLGAIAPERLLFYSRVLPRSRYGLIKRKDLTEYLRIHSYGLMAEMVAAYSFEGRLYGVSITADTDLGPEADPLALDFQALLKSRIAAKIAQFPQEYLAQVQHRDQLLSNYPNLFGIFRDRNWHLLTLVNSILRFEFDLLVEPIESPDINIPKYAIVEVKNLFRPVSEDDLKPASPQYRKLFRSLDRLKELKEYLQLENELQLIFAFPNGIERETARRLEDLGFVVVDGRDALEELMHPPVDPLTNSPH